MKKINLILLSIIFLTGTLNASFLPTPNPYAIGPEGRTVDDLAAKWMPPNRSVNILSGRPLRATDKDGTQSYYTTNGKLAVSFSKDGQATFTLGNMSISKDKDGKTISSSKTVNKTNLVEVTNEFGEVISYKELGFGGKIVAAFDKDKNLIATYNYNQYGKALLSVVNEMTKGMTVYEEKTGLPTYDLDVDGNRMAKYIHDDNGRLLEKIDAYGNIIHYDGNGAVTYAEDKDGVVMSRYNYKYDTDGNYVLESVVNPRTNEITYFDENGRQTVTKNHAGAITTDYLWRGSVLVATFDRERKETTWYEIDGKAKYTTFNDIIINKNLYYEGQLVGVWDARTNQVTVLQNERREIVIQLGGGTSSNPVELTTLVRCSNEKGESTVLTLKNFQENSKIGEAYNKIEEFQGYVLQSNENGNIVEYDPVIEPTAEEIKKWLDEGLIDKKYMYNPL
ncbi:MAG: hypothetical protein LBD46_04160 [Endomicrobium sp.]|jgi:hypothetical protein|nr:hypothetical protein [Endomicrobium sp.]